MTLPSLISLNEDLQRIQNEGISFDIRSGNLVADCVPYLTSQKEVKAGILVFELNMEGNKIMRPSVHTAYFVGEKPCELDGTPIKGLGIREMQHPLFDNIKSNLFFSCHLDSGQYPNYYEKMMNYWRIITASAENHDHATCVALKKLNLIKPVDSKLVYWDINSSRAHIGGLTDKFKGMKIAIIGIGGTGSYILDFVAKLPLSEIHLYDSDIFEQHNAFRAPGAASVENLKKRPPKVIYFAEMYSQMNLAVIPHVEMITPQNRDELLNMDFVFISIDNAKIRNEIAYYLIDNNKSFINSGIGISLVNDSLTGMIRITMGEPGHYEHLGVAFAGTASDDEEKLYRDNIQIAELNAFAAMESVMRWKQSVGFYQDVKRVYDCIYVINKNKIIYDDNNENG